MDDPSDTSRKPGHPASIPTPDLEPLLAPEPELAPVTHAVEETVVTVDPVTTKVMKANKRRDTKPELAVRRMLRELGYPGYRLDWKKAPGRPDIAFPGRRIAIFVNGCFWHHCPQCNPTFPKRNRAFWQAKIERNMARDRRVQAELRELGWTVIVIWEHELKKRELDATRKRLAEELAAACGPATPACGPATP